MLRYFADYFDEQRTEDEGLPADREGASQQKFNRRGEAGITTGK